MPHPDIEREHLGRAERDISEGEMRVTAQMLRIEQMRLDGRDTTEAERLLSTLQETLVIWREHRDEILRDLERHHALHPHR